MWAGAEHAVLHLLYARFWHKVLFDLGCVSTPEPFQRLVNQGLILGEMEYTRFADGNGEPVSAAELRDIAEEATPEGPRLAGVHKTTGVKFWGKQISDEEVEKKGEGFCLKANPAIRVDARTFKMSKSRGNVINPDSVLAEYGADAFRLYEMFMGPLEMTKPWSTKGVEGVYRFLGRVWRLFVDEKSETEFEQNLAADPSARAGVAGGNSAQPGDPGRDAGRGATQGVARVHQEGDRGPGRDAVQHGDFRDDGVRERGDDLADEAGVDLARVHGAAAALCAAHGGGAVCEGGGWVGGAAGLRGLAGVRPGVAGGEHAGDTGAGERQAAG